MSLVSIKINKSPKKIYKIFSELVSGDIIYVLKLENNITIRSERIISDIHKSSIYNYNSDKTSKTYEISFSNASFGIRVPGDKSKKTYKFKDKSITYSTYYI